MLSNRERYILYMYNAICKEEWDFDYATMRDFLYLMRNFNEYFDFGEDNDNYYACRQRNIFIENLCRYRKDIIQEFYKHILMTFERRCISIDLKNRVNNISRILRGDEDVLSPQDLDALAKADSYGAGEILYKFKQFLMYSNCLEGAKYE